ncbi:hypothetical protein H8356DRAFT_1425487 [Neocallimastix lanati (nom. inval.)]|nr:hypothetical protein H8356DRAFT_1425487 [Neocallimastix sp. JGI-2020a]
MIVNTRKPMNRFGDDQLYENYYERTKAIFVSKDAKLKGDEIKTFLDKAIRDAEDSIYNYNNVRIEMDITTQMI